MNFIIITKIELKKNYLTVLYELIKTKMKKPIFIILIFNALILSGQNKEYFNFEEALKSPNEVEVLTISEDIYNLPKEIIQFKNLRELNLLRTIFDEFPKEIFELSNLEKIYINAKINAFYEIPDKFNQLTNLTEFSITNIHTNRDTLFPESFYQLSNLKKLEVWAPNFPKRELDLLSSSFDLHTLNLSGTLLWVIPESFSKFQNIEVLILHNCHIEYEKRHEHSIKVVGLERLTSLKVLDLSDNYFKQFPIEILNLKLLEELHLEKNRIEVIPKNIENLKNLKYLYLGCNPFESFPKEVYALKSLKELSINGKGIGDLMDMKIMLEIPNGISNLENLEKLDMSNFSFLQHLPNDIVKLKKINYIDISYNPSLLSLNELNEIPSLKYINLMHINKLSTKLNYSFTNNIKTIIIDETISAELQNEFKKKCNNCDLKVKFDNDINWYIGYDCSEISRDRIRNYSNNLKYYDEK